MVPLTIGWKKMEVTNVRCTSKIKFLKYNEFQTFQLIVTIEWFKIFKSESYSFL